MRGNQASRGLILILLAAIMWGTVGVATKYIYQVSGTNALSIGFFRLLIATPVLVAFCWFTLGRRAFQIARRDLLFMILLGGAMAQYQVCYFAAIARVGVAIAVLITLCTAPVMVALFSAIMLRERLSGPALLSLGAALLGTVLLIMSGGGANVAIVPGQTLVGVLLALASALGYSTIALCTRTLAGRYHPLQPITVGFAAGALMLLPFALASGLVVSYPLGGWLALLHLGLVPTALAWILFGEQLGALSILGGLMLLGAIGLLYLASARRTPIAAQPVPAD